MNKENNTILQEKGNVHILISYGHKSLKECMQNVIIRKVSRYNK